MRPPQFQPIQAQELARAFEKEGVDYLFIGKRASHREKDMLDLEYLERFREEYERAHAKPLRSAAEITASQQEKKRTRK